jgi:hypothetical protein
MNHRALRPLALAALAALAACSKAEVEAKMDKAAENASATFDSLKREFEEIDLSGLSPEALKAKANAAAEALSEKLDEIDSPETAEKVKRAVEPVVDFLNRVKTAIGERMPSMDELQAEVEELRTRIQNDERVRKVLDPLLEKLDRLFE